MLTHGVDSLKCNIPVLPVLHHALPLFSRTGASAAFCQQPLRSYSCLLEGSDHFEGDAMHTLTDLHRTSCPPPLLASLQGLMRQLCFAFLLLQNAILTQISGVFLILLLVLYREEPEALVRALWPTATMATKKQLQVYRSSWGSNPPLL